MKKLLIKIFLSFCSIITFLSCKSSFTKIGDKNANYIPYYLKVYEADSLYLVNDFENSYKILDSLFKKYEPLNMDEYQEVVNYTKLKVILKKKISNKHLYSLALNHGIHFDRLKNDSILSNIFNNKSKLITKKYLEKEAFFIEKININLRNKIIEMIDQDQLYRNGDYQLNLKKQNQIDSINATQMKNIFEKFGYPNSKIIGDYSIDKRIIVEDIILLHTNDKDRISYFLPKVLEFIQKGTAKPKTYAFMFDQYNLYNGEEQYYGSYEKKVFISLNILNERRKKIGLPNYGYEKWRFSIMYPNEKY